MTAANFTGGSGGTVPFVSVARHRGGLSGFDDFRTIWDRRGRLEPGNRRQRADVSRSSDRVAASPPTMMTSRAVHLASRVEPVG